MGVLNLPVEACCGETLPLRGERVGERKNPVRMPNPAAGAHQRSAGSHQRYIHERATTAAPPSSANSQQAIPTGSGNHFQSSVPAASCTRTVLSALAVAMFSPSGDQTQLSTCRGVGHHEPVSHRPAQRSWARNDRGLWLRHEVVDASDRKRSVTNSNSGSWKK